MQNNFPVYHPLINRLCENIFVAVKDVFTAGLLKSSWKKILTSHNVCDKGVVRWLCKKFSRGITHWYYDSDKLSKINFPMGQTVNQRQM